MKRQFFGLGKRIFAASVYLLALTGLLTLAGCDHAANPAPAQDNFSISGVISLDNPQGPASSVTVILRKDGVNKGSKTTGQNGNYAFTNVLPGENYTISASLQGYKTRTSPAFSVEGNIAGKNLTLNKVVPATSFIVSGTIFADDSSPLKGAVVRLLQGGYIIGEDAITGADGKYSFPDISAGDNYTIEASLSGYKSSTSPDFSVSGSVADKNLILAKIRFNVSGTITADDPPAPVKGASVQLMKDGLAITAAILTGEDGKYTFTGVSIGTGFTIEVSYEGYKFDIIGPFDSPEEVTLIKNLALVKLTEPVYKVSGTISLNDNGPTVGALVQLKLGEENAGPAVTSGANGAFVIENVKAGEGYAIKVSYEGYEDGLIAPFNVVTADVTGKDITLIRIVHTVSGKVMMDNPAGTANGAAVKLMRGDGELIDSATTGENGAYSFAVVLPGSGYTIEVSFAGYTTKTSEPFNVSSDLANINLTLARIVYKVSGIITLNDAGAAVGAAVTLKQGQDGIALATDTTAAGGSYTFANVAPGVYTISVSYPEYVTGTIYPVNVTNADVTKNLPLVRTGYTVSGKITLDNNTTAASGATVAMKQSGSDFKITTANASGEYSFLNVPNGTYSISASYTGYQTGTIDSVVVSNANVAVKNLALVKIIVYSLTDLKVTEVTPTQLTSYGGYNGAVTKIAPKNGTSWLDWQKPITVDLSGRTGGFYKVSIFMSVWLEKPASLARAAMYTGPSQIVWVIENGTDNWGNYGEPVFYVPDDVPTGEWVDLVFSEYINLANSGTRKIYLDALNEDQGLVDLTLYVRHFKVTVDAVQPQDKVIALTFDDGPYITNTNTTEKNTFTLLDKLKELNIKATFFVNGMKIDAVDPNIDKSLTDSQRTTRKNLRQSVIKRIIDDGHEVANHSYSHNYLGGTNPADEGINTTDIPNVSGYPRTWPLTETQILKEIKDTQDAIQQAVYGRIDYVNDPKLSKFFRTPFTAYQKIGALRSAAASLGLPIIYGPGSRDAESPAQTSTVIANEIYNRRVPYAVFINHDPTTERPQILDALTNVVPRLLADGYRFVTVSEMEALRGRNLTPGKVYQNLSPDLP